MYMMEFTWYSVISPESCSSILWRSWDHKEEAAERLKLTSGDMLDFGLIDGVINEPIGGAHSDPEKMTKILKKQIKKDIADLENVSAEMLIDGRLKKYSKMGRFHKK